MYIHIVYVCFKRPWTSKGCYTIAFGAMHVMLQVLETLGSLYLCEVQGPRKAGKQSEAAPEAAFSMQPMAEGL